MAARACSLKADLALVTHPLARGLNASAEISSSFKYWVELDVMEPTDHAINTMPVTLVLAKNDKGETTISRFCIDARQLNKQILDTTPECVPSLNQVLGHAQGAYVYSTFDTVKAFWTSKLWPPDAAKACLNAAGQNFILKRLFFGLKTGSSQFHALMTEIINKKTYSDGTPVPGMQGKDFTGREGRSDAARSTSHAVFSVLGHRVVPPSERESSIRISGAGHFRDR
jgi:hypothetical protein